MPDKESCFVTSSPLNYEHKILLTDGLDDFSSFYNMLDCLEDAGPEDEVTLDLSCPGGSCEIGFNIVQAIQSCACPVHVHVRYPTYSMGAIIALSGSSLTFAPHSFIMFHAHSSSTHGKAPDIEMERKAFIKIHDARFKSICCPFLTPGEVNKIFKGQDLYIHHDDAGLQARLDRHFIKPSESEI